MAIINPVVYGAGGLKAELVISFENGAVVTATNGDTVLRATVNNKTAKIKLTKPGDWTITAVLGERTTIPQVITVLEEYPVTLLLDPIISKYPANPALSKARAYLAAASVGNYALFGGGFNPKLSPTYPLEVDVYDNTLTHSLATTLTKPGMAENAGSIGNHALFGYDQVVNAYDENLICTTPTGFSVSRCKSAVTHVGNHLLVGGGNSVDSSSSYIADVETYDQQLTHSVITSLSGGRTDLAAASVGEFALFAGGYNGSYRATVDAYNQGLTRIIPTALTVSRKDLVAASVGEFALFAGGYNGSYHRSADVYDQTLTRLTPLDIKGTHHREKALNFGNRALFVNFSSVEAYDVTLTRTTLDDGLSIARTDYAAAVVGNFALFGGGYHYTSTSVYYDVIDVYMVTQ